MSSAAGLCACAVALLFFLYERPRHAGVTAAVALGCGVLAAYDRTALVGSARELAGSQRVTAMLEILFGAAGLSLAFAARRVPREIAVALFLGLAVAFAADAIAVLGDALPIGVGETRSGEAVAIAMLAIALFGHGVRRDAAVLARPRLWLAMLPALAIATVDLLAPHAGALRCGYALVVACGAFFPERCVTRLYARLSVGLAAFGFAASWRSGETSVSDLALFGMAIGAILVMERVIDRLLRAEHALRELARERDALLQLTHSGCIGLDLAAMRVTPGPGCDAIEGLATPAPLAWTDFVASRIPPEQQAAVAANLAAARTGTPPAALSFQLRNLGSESREAALCWVARHDDRGALRGLTGLVHDRAQYRPSDCDRAELRMRLRNAQKLESLALLSGGVAHDLNNTLVPVSILAPLLFDSVADPADRRSVELIIEAAQRARDLARDMLAYARDDQPPFAPIALAELMRDWLPLLRARIPAHITLCDAIAPVPRISGNQRQMYQVLLNLAVNAAEAIGARAGSITIGTACEQHKDCGRTWVRMFVADDGEGMDPGLIEHAFEPFFSTKDCDHATGIGLSIVRRIVQLHGGWVTVESNPGGGTRFDLFFPADFTVAPAPVSHDTETRSYAEATLYRR